MRATAWVNPQGGWWWNASESGSGYALEVQGDQIFLGTFLYEPSGRSTWYAGNLTQQADGTYTGNLLRFVGGQTLSGNYKAPSSNTVVAAVTLSFGTPSTGSLQIRPSDGTAVRETAITRYPISTPAFAQSNVTYQSGWWWNESESGRGYFLEVQGSQVFVASFMYDDNGQPTWYATFGTLQSDGTTTTGALQQFANGQSLNGAYKPAAALPGNAGAFQFTGTNKNTCVLTLPNGRQVSLKRYPFNPSAKPKPFAINSIAFPLAGTNVLDDIPLWDTIPDMIQRFKTMGANDVKVTISAGSYDSPLSNQINPALNNNPSDAKILAFLKQLKGAGFELTIVPFVTNKFDPNGNLLDTVHSQPTNFNLWMAEHAAVMVKYAKMAQEVGAERFSIIGDEVQPLTYGTKNTEGWLNMIAQIRAVYSGRIITLAWTKGPVLSNGRSHIELIDKRIIDAIDILGVGYFPEPLTNVASPGLAAMLKGWRSNGLGVDSVAYLKALHTRYNKPIYISDISFHSFSGDNISPANIYDPNAPIVADQQEQADEYESLFTVLDQEMDAWFLGVSCDSWNRWPKGLKGVIARFLFSDYGEDIKGKLAENVLTQWFNGKR